MKRFIGWVVPTVLAQTLLFNPIAVAQPDADAQSVDLRMEQRAQYRQALEELRTGIGPRYRTCGSSCPTTPWPSISITKR